MFLVTERVGDMFLKRRKSRSELGESEREEKSTVGGDPDADLVRIDETSMPESGESGFDRVGAGLGGCSCDAGCVSVFS